MKTMVLAFAMLVATAPVSVRAQQARAQQLTPNYTVVEHGRSIKVASFGNFNPDCSPIGHTTINLTSAPQGGTVETAEGREYPRFASNNARFHCDNRRLPETVLYYRAAPSFTGADTFTVEAISGEGEARQIRYTVYVR